jgi:hypothetical protein
MPERQRPEQNDAKERESQNGEQGGESRARRRSSSYHEHAKGSRAGEPLPPSHRLTGRKLWSQCA